MAYADFVKAKRENDIKREEKAKVDKDRMAYLEAMFKKTGYGVLGNEIYVVDGDNIRNAGKTYVMDITVYRSNGFVNGVLTYTRYAGSEMHFMVSDDIETMFEAVLECADRDIEYKGLMDKEEIKQFMDGLYVDDIEEDEDEWEEDDEDDDEDNGIIIETEPIEIITSIRLKK